ncbi:MAG: hypothetical protein RBS57_11700 [Desulforhabdus sp.]|nr:hypothetical protein [Desulforhabdus sp.]
MKRLLAKLALLACLVTATLMFPFYTQLPYSHSLSLIINKLDLVRNTPSPKVVFVGGSGTYSGLDSKLVHKEMKCSAVNMAVYAGFGVLPILPLIEPFLRAGDVVVIVPEYGLIHSGLKNTEKSRKWLLAASPLSALDRYYPRSAEGLRYLLIDLADLSTSKLSILPQSLFGTSKGYHKSKRVMNEFGDMTGEAQFEDLPSDKLLDRGIAYAQKPVDANVIKELNRFTQSAARVGCRVFFVFAAFPEGEYEMNRAAFDALYSQLRAELGIPVLGTPYDFLYPYEYFQDSVNHLSAQGKTLRTRKMIELLKPRLADNPNLAERS